MHGRSLVRRQDLRRHLVDPEPVGHPVGDCLRVAGDHRNAHTEPMERGDRLRGLGSDLVLGREESADAAVHDHVEHRPALAVPRLGARIRLEADVA